MDFDLIGVYDVLKECLPKEWRSSRIDWLVGKGRVEYVLFGDSTGLTYMSRISVEGLLSDKPVAVYETSGIDGWRIGLDGDLVVAFKAALREYGVTE